MTGTTGSAGGVLSRIFPEKRVFVKSAEGTRFVRLGGRAQALAWTGGLAVVVWSVFATSLVLIDLVQDGDARAVALREQALYETRINELALERDRQIANTIEAQQQFARALEDVSRVQEELFEAQVQIREMENRSTALRNVLQRVLTERDGAVKQLTALRTIGPTEDDESSAPEADVALVAALAEAETTLSYLTGALSRTAAHRDAMAETTEVALTEATRLRHEARLASERNDRIFSQLEEAVTVSMEPLDQMFRQVGMPPEQILGQMRRAYTGEGGPLRPISFSTMGSVPDPETLRANAILNDLDELNLYRMAIDSLPFAKPVTANVRQTSGFGYRRDPVRGGSRLHAGMDWAGNYGTPIYASADGVIVHAGWQSGYGRLIKIQHEFGIETRFAHLSKINVRVGQRVSRGDKIGAMGNSGRSTGTHLHYEVRVGGKPVNPLNYIRAARDVL